MQTAITQFIENNIGTETWVFEVDYARLRDVPIEAAQGVTCMVGN